MRVSFRAFLLRDTKDSKLPQIISAKVTTNDRSQRPQGKHKQTNTIIQSLIIKGEIVSVYDARQSDRGVARRALSELHMETTQTPEREHDSHGNNRVRTIVVQVFPFFHVGFVCVFGKRRANTPSFHRS